MDRQETPETYIAFRGSHHGGTTSVVVREGIDVLLSGMEGVIMMYLLTFAFCQLLVRVSKSDKKTTNSDL